jgi:hypothetical protein
MGRTQQRARWPMAEQTALKSVASVGAEGATFVSQVFGTIACMTYGFRSPGQQLRGRR